MTRLTSDRSPLTMAIVAAAARMRSMTGCRGVKLAAELAQQLNESSVWAQTVVCGGGRGRLAAPATPECQDQPLQFPEQLPPEDPPVRTNVPVPPSG